MYVYKAKYVCMYVCECNIIPALVLMRALVCDFISFPVREVRLAATCRRGEPAKLLERERGMDSLTYIYTYIYIRRLEWLIFIFHKYIYFMYVCMHVCIGIVYSSR